MFNKGLAKLMNIVFVFTSTEYKDSYEEKMRGILKSKTGQKKPGFRPVLFKPKMTLLAQPAILQHRLNLRIVPAPVSVQFS